MRAVTASSRFRRPRPAQPSGFVAKPRGLLHPRVQQVGPERFGILCVDSAKSRSMWMLADFYGKVLWPATIVGHSKGDLETAIGALREVMTRHGVRDLIAALERTGDYHLPVKRTLISAGWEVRIVHPYATKQYRQPADPGNKTDQTDLFAIHRAAVAGLGLVELEPGESYRQLRLWTRHRRDLVQKATALRCQIQEHLHAAMPGFAQLFDDLWDTRVPMVVAQYVGSASALISLGEAGLVQLLKQRQIRHQHRTVEKILAWSRTAACADPDSALRRQIGMELEEDQQQKQARIDACERQIARILVGTPYILLLSIPGIHVVSAAEFAGEMGPISHYASPNHITGRAGIFPSRYQSDRTDYADGPLVFHGNRRLRAAIMTIADNLAACNDYFGGKVQLWQAQGKASRMARVKTAKTFTRIAFHMVAGGQSFHHPCCRERAYILDKLIAFSQEHRIPAEEMLTLLRTAVQQLPHADHKAEAQAVNQWLRQTKTARSKQPQSIGEILSLIMIELAQKATVQSKSSGNQDPG